MSMWTPDLIEKTLSYVGIAALGGLARDLMRDDGEPKTFRTAMIEAFASGVVGYIVFQACTASDISQGWTGSVVGLSGLIGARAAIELLKSIVSQKLGLPTKKEDAK